jgi:predicted metalloprotease
MQDDDLRASGNIEDRRGMSGGVGRGGLGVGAILVIGLLSWATGIDPRLLLGGAELVTGGSNAPTRAVQGRPGVPSDQMGQFIARVLGETEDVWTQILPQQTGKPYEKPVLVLFTGVTRSGCGTAQSAMGPFYCPVDRKLYLDTSFFQDMQSKLGGGGNFAYAYVIAHEVGHHVQNLLGITDKASQLEERGERTGAGSVSVRVELQADCFAGVWAEQANKARKILEPGDLEQGLQAASAVGDDTLQKREQGTVVPDSFTHGTSAQRVKWFRRGFDSGSIDNCDTFGAGAAL